MANVNIKVGYTVDKTGLNEIKKQLADIRVEAASAKMSGKLTEDLQNASKAATQLENILNSAWNSKLGQLDLSKVNTGIKNTYGTVQNLQKALVSSGSSGTAAYNNFARSVLNANVQLKQSSQLLDKMAITFKNTVRYGISSSVFNNLSNSVQKAYDYTVKLDKSLNDIRIVTGLSADEMDKFAVQANRVAKDLGRSTKDFTQAALIYYQQGLSSQESQARAEVTMKAANVTGQSGQDVSEQLTAVWNGYKVTAEEAELYVDKLAAVAATTAADLEELSTGMSKVASAANLMGVDIDQLNAQLATVVSVTRQAPESVGVAFKTIYARMSDIKSGLDDETTLGNYTSKMAQYGINVLDANDNLRDMGDVIEEIGGKWNKLSREQQVALAQTMAGTRQYNNLLSLFDNWDMYTKALDTSRNSAGELQKQQDIYMESTEAHLQRLATEAEKTYSILFNQDDVRGFIDLMQQALALVNSYLNGLGGGMKTIATLGLQVSNIFSKQISESITRQLENSRIQNESQDIAKLKEDVINSRGYDQNTGLNQEQEAALDKELEYAKEIASVRKVLTEEEYKELTAQQEEIGNLEEQIQHYKRIEKEVDAIAQKYNMVLATEDDFNAALEDTQNEAKRLNKLIKNIDSGDWNNTSETQAQYVQFLQETGVEEDKINSILGDEEQLRLRISSAYESTILKQNELKQGKEYLNSLDEDELAQWQAQQNSLQNSINKTVQLKNEQMRIQTIVRGTTTLLSTMTSIQGIISTLGNDQLTGWEKLGQVMSVAAVQGVALLSGFKEIKNLLPALAIQLGVISTEEGAIVAFQKEGILLQIKDIALQTVKNVLVAIEQTLKGNITALGVVAVAAIAAATVAMGAWIVKMIQANSEENKLKEAVQETKEEVQKATDAYNELRDNISKYTDAKKAIDDLKEGTVEFYEAITKSNEAAQELIDSLNLLVGRDYTIDNNGLININSDVLSERQFRSQQEIYRRSANANSAQAALEQYNQDKIVKQFAAEVNRQSVNVRLSEDQARNILDNATESNTELGLLNTSFNTYGPGWIAATEKSTIDITNAMAKYWPQYSAQQAKIDSLERQQSANLIRGYGDQQFVEQYNNMTAAQQDSINKYVADQRKANRQNLQAKDKGFWDYAGDVAINSLINAFTFGIGGTARGIYKETENENNKAIAKEAYAQNVLGYQNQSGAWYDRYGNAVDYNKMLKEIDTKTAVNAYNSGEYSTLDATQEMIKVIREAKTKAYAQGANETSQNYVSEAYAAIKTGNKNYDFSLLTNQEKDIVKSMLGGRTSFREIQEPYYNPYNIQNNFQRPGTIDYSQFGQRPQFQSPYSPQPTQPKQGGQTRYEIKQEYTNASPDLSVEQIDEWLKHSEEVDRSAARIKADLEAYNGELKSQAEALDTSTKALELYGYAMRKAGDLTEDRTKETAKAIAEEYSFNKAYNEAADTFEDTKDAYKTYIDALKSGKKVSYDTVDQVAELQEKLEEMLGMDLSPEFLEQNYDDIKTMLSGTADEAEDAYNRIQQSAIKDALQNSLNFSADEATNLVNYLATLDPGAELSSTWTKRLVEMINNANMTVDEVESLFANMHIEMPPPDDYTIEEQSVKSEAVSTKHTYDGYIPVPDSKEKDGYRKVKINYSWTETTEPVEQKYFKFKDQNVTLSRSGNSPKGSFGRAGSGNFTRSPSSGKSGGGGGGSSKQPDNMDSVEKEADRYHDVDIQLKQIQTDIDKLDKQKKKLFGQDLIGNLNKKIKLLDKQIDTTNEKIKIAQGETQELQNKLSGKGVAFNADGTIANYAQAYASQLNYVNGLIAQYNSMSATAQEGFKDTVEKAKEDFDKFVDNIDRYDELITNTIPGLEKDIQSAVDEKIDLQIEKFDMEIELRLDLAEAERDWNEFKKKIIDGIEDDDILGNAMARLVDFSSYYKEDNTGIVQALRKQVDNTLAELNQMDTNGWSNVYGNNRTAALDDLKKYYEELMSNLTDVLELQKEIHESYIDMMDKAQEKFDEQIEAYEMISDLIEHDMEVISLIYGEQSYGQLAKYYDKQQQNFNSQLDFQRQQADFWRQQLDTLEEGSDEWENAREKWADAVQSMNDLIEESIQNLQDKYLNAINLIFQNLNNKITDNLGLEYIEEEWNLINKNADQYLDTINSLYEVQKLEGKYLDALDQTDSISAQRQLKKIMDEELADLRERDKLTQYDIERANKKYEIALKQIALQEAQQNKSKMRLRRDSQGNYRYEYTSDADQIGQLQDELNDMYNSLYNFDKARYQDNLNQMYDVWVEFQEKMAEAAQINDPVARSERELLLQSQYEQLINGLTEQNTTVRNNLHESAFDDLSRLYDIDVANFQNMSDEEKDVLMGDLLPYWESGVQHMTDVFAGEGGFLGVCKDAFDQLHDATKDYEDGLDELENTGRIDFESIGEGIDENINRTQQLISDNTELINSYEQELTAIGNVIAQLDDLVNKYNAAKDAAVAATKAAYEYWSEQQRQAVAAAGNANGGSGSGNGNSGSGNGSSGSGAGGGSALGGDNNLVVGETATYSGKYYYDSYGSSPTGSKYSGVANGIVVDRITNNPYGIHIHSTDGRYRDLGWIKKSQLSGYDTGGYTGEWGSDGRLALLHQKELVLNKEDTANMLNAISIMRNITNMLGSSVLGKLAAATAGGLGTEVSGDVLEQNVHIDAQFPNVKDSREIEEALNNLVNMASMRANRR